MQFCYLLAPYVMVVAGGSGGGAYL